MTTAYRAYQKPVDDINALYGDDVVDDYRERKVYSLRERDDAEDAMQRELDRPGAGVVFWNLPTEEQDALMDQVDRWRGGKCSYREAVENWLRRRGAAE